jgi:hypothetical protein
MLLIISAVKHGGSFKQHIQTPNTVIKGLRHNAYCCCDSEETRTFYKEFLELTLTDAFPILETKTGR